ncbi:MAG: hypothetical protein UIG59_03210 [Acutalibacteraceae bacterium]|nr:hypothetical protein [Acutalibacteraceae bacterium]
MNIKRLPRIGLLFIGAERFMELGEGTANGTYLERKLVECESYKTELEGKAEIVASEIVCTKEGAEVWADKFYASQVDCVVTVFLSWAEDTPWIAFLRKLFNIPLMLASVVRKSLSITDTNDEDQFIDFLSAGALVGFLEASGSVRRFSRDMVMLEIDTLDRLIPKVLRFATAAKAIAMLKKSKISLLACYNRAMWSTYVDPYNVFEKIGPELEFLSVAELCREIENVSKTKVETVMEELKSKYKVMNNVDEAKFEASVRATIAMEHLALSVGTDLLVLNDIDKVLFEFVGLRPGFTPTRPDLELISVPEGDIGGGLAVYFLSLLTGRTANFIEPFYIDEQNGGFVAGHAGPNNYTERPENMIIARDERFAKSKWKHAGAPFAWYVFPEGEKTMLHVSEANGRLKLVATLVECLPTKHYLASYSHANFRHKHLHPCELFKRIGECGVNQHFGIVSGNILDEIRIFAELMDFDLHIIQ